DAGGCARAPRRGRLWPRSASALPTARHPAGLARRMLWHERDIPWKGGAMGRHAVAAGLAGLALSTLACARPPDPASTTCLRVLNRRLPEARVLEVRAPREAHAVVRFEVGARW